MKTLLVLSLALAGIAQAQTIHGSNPPHWWLSEVQSASTELTCGNSTCECEADGKTCRKPAPKKPAGQKKAQTVITHDGEAWCISENGAGAVCEHEPIDVPAIQETRVVHAKGECWGGAGLNLMCAEKDITEPTWKCKDDNRGLIVSQNGKFAVCHKVQP